MSSGANSPTRGGLGRYPRGSDAEVVAALRFALEARGWRPEDLERRAGLAAGAVGALLAGHAEPSGPVLRKICRALDSPRWLFHLTGATVVGADVGYEALSAVLEKRRRALAGNPDQVSRADLVVEAVEILLAIGEDVDAPRSPEGPRRSIADGLSRLSRRAETAGLARVAALAESVATFVRLGVEDLALAQLQPPLIILRLDGSGAEPEELGPAHSDVNQEDRHGSR